MSYKLTKPYTEKQKADAVSKYYNVIFDVAVYLYAKQGAEGRIINL